MTTPLDQGFKPYRSYGQWLRKRYQGAKVYKVIVDAGFTCPNRDGSKGYGGCTYCNVDSFTPQLPRSLDQVHDQVAQGIQRARVHYGAEKFIIYFQPNTNTYAPVERLKELYDTALSICPEHTVGLSVGTRPDCLDADKIALLESYAPQLDVDLELGMESIHESTLATLNRGCSHAELTDLLERLHHSPLALCVHTIFGLPGETRDMMLAHASEVNRFPHIRFIKLHHLHIVRGSILGNRYLKDPFPLFSLDEYTDFLCDFLPLLRPDIVVQRLFGLADLKYLIAPNWLLRKSEIQHHIDSTLEKRGILQGSRLTESTEPSSRQPDSALPPPQHSPPSNGPKN